MCCYKKNIYAKVNKILVLNIFLCIFIVLLISTAHSEAINNNSSVWDYALPSLELNDVEIKANSLQDAWKTISDKYLFRSILVVLDNSVTSISFSFNSPHCTGAELLDALVGSYRDFIWTQDDKTGIIWIYPRKIKYEEILPLKIYIENDQIGVPMQDGILEAIEDIQKGIRIKRLGVGFTNTFNYQVNLKAGEYKIRDVLNICCSANPSKTFYIQHYAEKEPKYSIISAVNISSEVPTRGILLFWNLEIGNLNEKIPTNEQIATELADSDPRIRWAAQMYAEGALWNFSKELKNISVSQEQSLWVYHSAISVYVRSEETTYTDGINELRKADKDFFERGDPNLAVLVALDLAGLANDTNALSIVSKRKFTPGAINHIRSEINYNARIHKKVRESLHKTGTEWLSDSEPMLKDIDKISSKAQFIKVN